MRSSDPFSLGPTLSTAAGLHALQGTVLPFSKPCTYMGLQFRFELRRDLLLFACHVAGFTDVMDEPVPDEFKQLLKQLEDKERGA